MINRRNLLAATALLPTLCNAQSELPMASDFWNLPRELWLYRPQTKETVRAVYWYDGKLNVPGYDEICWILRDVQSNTAVQMNLALLDVLRGIRGCMNAEGMDTPLITNSGYRSPLTNQRTEGAARDSEHVKANAWDGRVTGVSTLKLARYGVYLAGGGVGFYQSRDFLHVDGGRKRQWRG